MVTSLLQNHNMLSKIMFLKTNLWKRVVSFFIQCEHQQYELDSELCLWNPQKSNEGWLLAGYDGFLKQWKKRVKKNRKSCNNKIGRNPHVPLLGSLWLDSVKLCVLGVKRFRFPSTGALSVKNLILAN